MPLRIEPGATPMPTPDEQPSSSSNPALQNEMVGTRLGRYEILGVMGCGSMGTVFQARDPNLGRIVAVKTIRLAPSSAEDEKEFRLRLLREAEAAARIAHPGIVTIFDVGHDENHEPYFVMEYVEGKGLDQLIKAKALSPEAALDIAIQLAQALDYAHRQRIVHRDIKPSNIIITPEGRAKITDFGIAKLDISQITLPGLMLGTPAYMAPEQLIGDAVDGRSDLYSVGVILYLMLTGKRPFHGDDPDTVCRRLMNPDAAPIQQADPSVPERLVYIITRALAKKPADRYQTGMEMALDLQDFRDGREPRTCNTAGSEATARLRIPARWRNAARRWKAPYDKHLRELRRSLLRVQKLPLAIALAVTVLAAISVYHAARGFVPPTTTLPAPAATSSAPSELKTQPIDAADWTWTTAPDSSSDEAESRKPKAHRARPALRIAKRIQPKAPTPPPQPKPAALKTDAVPAAEPPKPATIHLSIQHSFKSGNVTVWSDGQLIYLRELSGTTTKHLVVLSHSEGFEAAQLKVPVGEHTIKVRVQADDFDDSNSIQATFSDKTDTTLHVDARKGKGVELSLE
ncbi:MAG: serine/threonine protein kinase [Acidobacteria bacterium]|nr:serine/threonine protein kinase [Acidobacteriota bacterium]